ncbi:MAG: hypothetical protein MUC49_19090 [Raineya sp.]|jgi:hypothetical protein|nr:hypothetical protein [Raineya sp.]
MRYFLVSYIAPDGFGSIWFEHSEFPNYQWLCQKITDSDTKQEIIVLNIYEFKNKIDFDTFRRES